MSGTDEPQLLESPEDEGGETVSLEARVVRPLFTNEESGWAAVRMKTAGGERLTAVGPLIGVRDGDTLHMTGRWKQHERFGRQLEVQSWIHVSPRTPEGLAAFLASGRLPGVGPVMARRLIEAFGMEVLDVLDNHPERLTSVPGIGARTAAKITKAWEEARGIQQIMVFLLSHGIPPGVAIKAHKRYGASALAVVRENPYRLADEVFGVGFRTADGVARSLGVPLDAPERLQAGLLFTLQEASGEGHVYLPEPVLFERAAAILETGAGDLPPHLEELETSGKVVAEGTNGQRAVYLPRLHRAEVTVAGRLFQISRAPARTVTDRPKRAVQWYEQRSGLELDPTQRHALTAALTEKILVVTGGPGTGKTTLVRGLTSILAAKDRSVELAAPTGRAAKRLAEATGRKARTIHRLLEYTPASHSFARSEDNPISADSIVIDETSMLDVELAAALLRAAPSRGRLLLVGDADQLPSVGPGSVLADLIASGALPVVRLEHIFRQAAQSLIVQNAHRINRGHMPLIPKDPEGADFFFIEREDPGALVTTVGDLVQNRIPKAFGLDPVDDIQVMAPMHRGDAGVAALNAALRQLLNPPDAGPELVQGSRSFRGGDKVMQIRNNYDLEIFNGDLGRIASVDPGKRSILAVFDGRLVEIPPEGIEDLQLAYCSTIHKSQGSEFPAVVVVLHHSHHIMLERNLLYTAVTRGRRLVVIVGSRRALHRAVRTTTQRKRHTGLAPRLQDLFGQG
ncbi:MAG: ATP-dependent RecD-like DNA helicase [Acidobacteria bacterium]|nr:ATP-dependent RecD-like DNA helicase [Acidobacteriota bacterium]